MALTGVLGAQQVSSEGTLMGQIPSYICYRDRDNYGRSNPTIE